MNLLHSTFHRLRYISEDLNKTTLQATGLYRELASECRRLLADGVDKSTINRELIDAGRTASRASELLSVAQLSQGQFEHFISGEMGWKLALTSSRTSLEFQDHWQQLGDLNLPMSTDTPPPAAAVVHEGTPPRDHYSKEPPYGGFPHQPIPPLPVRPTPPPQDRTLFPDQAPPLPKYPPLSLSIGEQKAVNIARLSIELLKVAKLSRKSFIDQPWSKEIGGFRITIEPLEQ